MIWVAKVTRDADRTLCDLVNGILQPERHMGNYFTYIKTNSNNLNHDLVFIEPGSHINYHIMSQIFKSNDVKIDICFLSDCNYSKIAPRYIKKNIIQDFSILLASEVCCLSSFYISKEYALKLSVLDNVDQFNMRIMNDIKRSDILAAKIYPQLVFCPIDRPHTPKDVHVEMLGRQIQYPYSRYISLIIILVVLFLIVTIFLILRRCKK